MTLRDQAIEIIEKFKRNNPAKIFKNVSESEAGMTYILMMLSEASEEMYASHISERMHVSRARVAVLLSKLENKGYITKSTSPSNAKIEVINLTGSGFMAIHQFHDKLINNMIKLIENIGYNKLHEFINTAEQIKNTLHGEGE